MLVTILISYIVYNTFTDWETVIAGCIGFVGAILGGIIAGFVTLEGVKRTINFTNDIEFNNKKPEKIKAAHKLVSSLDFFDAYLNVKNYDFESKRKTIKHLRSDVNEFFQKDELFVYAATLNSGLYKELVELDRKVTRKISESEAQYKNIFYIECSNDEKKLKRLEITKRTYSQVRVMIFRFASEVEGFLEELIDS